MALFQGLQVEPKRSRPMTTVTDTKVSERGVEHQSSTLGDTKVHPNRRKGSEARRPGEDEGRRQGRVDRYRFQPTRESKNQPTREPKKKKLGRIFFSTTRAVLMGVKEMFPPFVSCFLPLPSVSFILIILIYLKTLGPGWTWCLPAALNSGVQRIVH